MFVSGNKKDVPDGIRIFGARFIDEIKAAGQGLRRKSRLAAQNYSDEAEKSIGTRASAALRSYQILLLSIDESMSNLIMFSRDITQTYIQSDR